MIDWKRVLMVWWNSAQKVSLHPRSSPPRSVRTALASASSRTGTTRSTRPRAAPPTSARSKTSSSTSIRITGENWSTVKLTNSYIILSPAWAHLGTNHFQITITLNSKEDRASTWLGAKVLEYRYGTARWRSCDAVQHTCRELRHIPSSLH